MKKRQNFLGRVLCCIMAVMLTGMMAWQDCPAQGMTQGTEQETACIQSETVQTEEPDLPQGGIMSPPSFSEQEIRDCQMSAQELRSYAGIDDADALLAEQEMNADLISRGMEPVSANSCADNEKISVSDNTALQENAISAETLGYATIEDAADYLRGQMVKRKTYIKLRLAKGNDSAQRNIQKILEQSIAYDEACSPSEGDYLRWNFVAFRWSMSDVTKESVTYNIAIAWRTDADEEKYVSQQVAQIIRQLDLSNGQKSEYEKVRQIYAYIMDHVTYDYYHYATNRNYMPMYTAYAALHDGVGVCQAYALVFYRLCQEVGISARLIAGNDEGGVPTHGWNIVRIGEYYYNVDATWDDETVSKNVFFLKNQSDFRLHTRNMAYTGDAFEKQFPTAPVSYCPISATGNANDSCTGTENDETVAAAGSLVLTQNANNKVLVKWTAIAGTQRYYVYRKNESGDYACVGTTTDTSYENMIPGAGNYTYMVYASDGTRFFAVFAETPVQCEELYLKKGERCQVDGCKYRVLKSTALARTVAFAGVVSKNESAVRIPDSVVIDGLNYKVTEIAAGALRGKTSLKTVSIGKNVTKIGKKAFYGCKRLVHIVVRGKNIKSVGKGAFKRTGSYANVYLPKTVFKKYKKLFSGKGLSAKAKIKK